MNKIILASSVFVMSSLFTQPVKTVEASDQHKAKLTSGKISGKPTKGRLGRASWYGPKFHGKKTASGRKFDMYAMTAAHKTLPLLSYVKVTNPKSHKSVVVQITDRGPYHGKRELDLSYAAAKEVGIQKQGVGFVEIQPLSRSQAITEIRNNDS
ncbi:septal ring lytic transglycosylase RlpA family protein [Methylotuvimicrobium alcaliphilum]|uniref:Endolytic peptidoglycan transglycosylase RlpA n=1 Tax=Methylotuvimicrobium alcaliphilum (strain DSM 19304 / NCIMB 14124 / VKM B-2133 / 20Z) TaxID=1091494 RepID=G4SWQ1_META2|nr:septal ring lytic transglycosylase RlpA family protein [Methylotuvimicrobium alcaliphilum]CCE25277.1 Rare lipoprotein A [Methylotuvimicrobium alcaliphilum 20Z]